MVCIVDHPISRKIEMGTVVWDADESRYWFKPRNGRGCYIAPRRLLGMEWPGRFQDLPRHLRQPGTSVHALDGQHSETERLIYWVSEARRVVGFDNFNWSKAWSWRALDDVTTLYWVGLSRSWVGYYYPGPGDTFTLPDEHTAGDARLQGRFQIGLVDPNIHSIFTMLDPSTGTMADIGIHLLRNIDQSGHRLTNDPSKGLGGLSHFVSCIRDDPQSLTYQVLARQVVQEWRNQVNRYVDNGCRETLSGFTTAMFSRLRRTLEKFDFDDCAQTHLLYWTNEWVTFQNVGSYHQPMDTQSMNPMTLMDYLLPWDFHHRFERLLRDVSLPVSHRV